MKAKTLFILVAAFILGIVSSIAVTYYIPSQQNTHSVTTSYVVESEKTLNDNSSFITQILGSKDPERASPYDRIAEENIHVDSQKVVINIPNAQWARFTDTNSMDPVLDQGTNAIEIVPKDPSEIHVGDIVSYQSDYADGIIIHRIIETGYDNSGWYCLMKGDNNERQDPGKIRFSQIKRVVVAIIY